VVERKEFVAVGEKLLSAIDGRGDGRRRSLGQHKQDTNRRKKGCWQLITIMSAPKKPRPIVPYIRASITALSVY
jgi:hypothetical protein